MEFFFYFPSSILTYSILGKRPAPSPTPTKASKKPRVGTPKKGQASKTTAEPAQAEPPQVSTPVVTEPEETKEHDIAHHSGNESSDVDADGGPDQPEVDEDFTDPGSEAGDLSPPTTPTNEESVASGSVVSTPEVHNNGGGEHDGGEDGGHEEGGEVAGGEEEGGPEEGGEVAGGRDRRRACASAPSAMRR